MYIIKVSNKFKYNSYKRELSNDLTVFQSATIQKEYSKNKLFYSLPKRMTYKVFEVYDENEVMLILPAYINNNRFEMAGDTNGIGNLSPIFFSDSLDNFCDYMKYLLSNLNYNEYVFNRVLEGSKLANYIDRLTQYRVSKQVIQNVKIIFNNDYDLWHSSLKKSVRQNLRTAYNRLEKDGLDYHVEFYDGDDISKSLITNMVRIYDKRHKEHYNVKTSYLKELYMRYFYFSTRSLSKNKDARHCILFINGTIAAFYSGYFDSNSKSIILPRLSIDADFSRYSPGYILLNEAIKEYSKNKFVDCIDLSTGVEKYKTDLGGTIYNKLDYTITKV